MGYFLGAYNRSADLAGVASVLDLDEAKPRSAFEKDWNVWTAPPCMSGLTGFQGAFGEGLICGYGDRVDRQEEQIPLGGRVSDMIEWCRKAMLRFAGAYCTTDSLFLWTDETASCPLFYTTDESGHPLFASEAKALLAMLPEALRVLKFDQTRPLPAPGQSVFARVNAVPPGSVVCLIRTESQWTLQSTQRYYAHPRRPYIVDEEEGVRLITDTLEASVKRATDDLDELGITLSGGVDSSSVAVLARRHVRRIRSFTVGTPFGNEFESAREVATLINVDDHAEFVMDVVELRALLPHLVWALETCDLLTLKIAAPTAFLYRQLAGDPPVFLTGYGADLIFAGVVNGSVDETRLERAICHDIAMTVPTNELAPFFARRYGITVRYPFWSQDMLRAGLSLRARLKVRHGTVKYILRRSMERHLPASVAWRPKVGIHVGTSMQRLFSEALGTSDEGEQCRLLRTMARRLFVENLVPPTVGI